MSVSPTEFRAACGLFPTGVTVVTRRLADGRPHGMTVSSFTSVSLEPPLILVCIDRAAVFLEDLPSDLQFAINVLHEDQQALSRVFSNRNEAERFANAQWDWSDRQVPLLFGVIATFECTLQQAVEAGDHVILVSQVDRLRSAEGRPLVWCDRSYHCLSTR